ncbi:NERD domain-containing protein [Sutcliffiella horikoshii]|uniref:NERD domain-containing protein n=1 Tax=Sutcliffiella horikoshii TaxID=79883 RepID=A0AA94WK99_9BACI|nr:nuclease-related domain-containing protein [Sutcliffiella horikoshii]TYS57340.1 NERD domain-containing protein [Sutcliffiella horikoshii]
MITKDREKPLRLLAHEAAMRRVPKTHPKHPQIEQEFYRLHYGYKGEQAMDYYSSFLPHEDYKVLHGLRVPDTKGRHFQMDSLLISPTHCLILDSKYVSGKIEFDEDTGSLIRHNETGQERLGDPFAQLARHKIQLSSIIEGLKLPQIPIYTQIVITHKNATLLKKSPLILKNVVFHTNLPTRIKEIDNTQTHTYFSNKDANKLVKTLLKIHQDENFNLMNYYGFSSSSFIRGVICPICSHAPMQKSYQKWLCLKCGHSEKELLQQTIKDYPLLGFGNKITNREFREFICLHSSHIAYRELLSLNIPHQGNKKARIYFIE